MFINYNITIHFQYQMQLRYELQSQNKKFYNNYYENGIPRGPPFIQQAYWVSQNDIDSNEWKPIDIIESSWNKQFYSKFNLKEGIQSI